MNAPVLYDSQSLAILNTLYANYIATNGYVPKYDSSNTASVDSLYVATLQGLSGEVEFSNVSIPVGDAIAFTINNSYATALKKVYACIAARNNGYPYVIEGTCGTGTINIILSSLVDPEDAVTIGFLFLN